MPCLPNNPDRDFSAGQSEDDINANVAELFASRPLGVAELFADPIVQMRIGRLITEAMSKRTRRQRADKPRQASISAGGGFRVEVNSGKPPKIRVQAGG